MKPFNTLYSIFRRRWARPSAFSYDDFEITDFDHSPYIDYGSIDADEVKEPSLS